MAPTKRGRDRDLDLKGLESVLKYQFKNPALAHTAMTHRSYLHATPGRSGDSNERMEFLGDSVVGLGRGWSLGSWPRRSGTIQT